MPPAVVPSSARSVAFQPRIAGDPDQQSRMLTLRHIVLDEDDTYRANPKEIVLLQYYANAIVHLFESPLAIAA